MASPERAEAEQTDEGLHCRKRPWSEPSRGDAARRGDADQAVPEGARYPAAQAALTLATEGLTPHNELTCSRLSGRWGGLDVMRSVRLLQPKEARLLGPLCAGVLGPEGPSGSSPGGSNLVMADHAGKGGDVTEMAEVLTVSDLRRAQAIVRLLEARGVQDVGLWPRDMLDTSIGILGGGPLFQPPYRFHAKARPVPTSSRSPRIWRRWRVSTSSHRLRRRRSRGLSPAMTLPHPRA